MRRAASTPVALIVGAVEILDFRIALIEVEMQVVAAIGTDQQARKHTGFTLMGFELLPVKWTVK